MNVILVFFLKKVGFLVRCSVFLVLGSCIALKLLLNIYFDFSLACGSIRKGLSTNYTNLHEFVSRSALPCSKGVVIELIELIELFVFCKQKTVRAN